MHVIVFWWWIVKENIQPMARFMFTGCWLLIYTGFLGWARWIFDFKISELLGFLRTLLWLVFEDLIGKIIEFSGCFLCLFFCKLALVLAFWLSIWKVYIIFWKCSVIGYSIIPKDWDLLILLVGFIDPNHR